MKRTIKLCDGFIVLYKGETEKYEGLAGIWEAFGWDIKNDPNAKECADIITRELFCFGNMTLKDDNGYPIHIQAIPTQN